MADFFRIIILFGIATVAVLFGLGMFQEDDMIPTPEAGTEAGNQTDQVREAISSEYSIFGFALVLGLISLAFVILIAKVGRII